MKFKAKYLHRRQEQESYWLTIHADTINEASKQADKMARKGFICVGVTARF